MSRKELILVGIVSGAVGGAVSAIVAIITLGFLEWLLPAVPSAYTVAFFTYNTVMTLVAIAFGMVIAYMLWKALRSIWNLKDSDYRRKTWEKIREKVGQWPTGKREAIIAMTYTWSIAIVVSFNAWAFTAPRARFTGQELQGTALAIILLAVTPILLLAFWHIYEFAKIVWLEWRTETRKGRSRIAATAIVAVLIYALFVWGIISGWEDRLWFAN